MNAYRQETHLIGDTRIRYLIDKNGTVELRMIPASAVAAEAPHRETMLPDPALDHLPWRDTLSPAALNSLVQISISGSPSAGGFAGGRTMRGCEATAGLRFASQEVESGTGRITTRLDHPMGFTVFHYLEPAPAGHGADLVFRAHSEFVNDTDKPVPLELITSFCLGGITPFDSGQAAERLVVHRFRSTWSAEGRHESIPVETLNLERSWIGHSTNCERFGQVGSMPVRGFFPVAAVEDKIAGVMWGATLCWAGSWQMEFYRKDDFLSFSGGLADREFGHWMRHIAPGERFTTPEAIIATVCGDIDTLCDRLLQGQKSVLTSTAAERELPVIFNEWCTSWGEPSHESAIAIADRLSGTGVKYLVMDAGWYKRDGSDWGNGQGDWQVNDRLFPEGLRATSRAIRDRGMIPGLWFEMEVAGSASDAYHMTELLLKRDGVPLTVAGRRFWDLRNPEAVEYLSRHVIDLLESAEIGYLKVDYNETIGIGVDGAESLGEGARQHILGVYAFFRRIRERLPELVIENCSSGGHRLEPSMMALTDMGSFSDAHESLEIPIIAANLHRLIRPAQSQIWAVLHADDEPRRTRYLLTAGFLGRLCLSGEIWELDTDQMNLVTEAIDFYRGITDIIRDGHSRIVREISMSYREPRGAQCVFRTSGDRILAVVTVFGGDIQGDIAFELPGDDFRIESRFEGPELTGTLAGNRLLMRPTEPFSAAAYLLRR